jgi:DNA replication factor GINS
LYDELFTAWKLEKNSEAIQPLPSDFFRQVLGYLSELKESRSREKVGSSIDSARRREIDYVEFMLSNLLKMRAKKIALLSLEDSSELASDLIETEAGLVERLRGLMREYAKQCSQPSNASEIVTEKSSEMEARLSAMPQDNSALMLLRVLQPIPKLVGVDLDEYGPFQPEDIVSLPRENALVLIARGAASEVKI